MRNTFVVCAKVLVIWAISMEGANAEPIRMGLGIDPAFAPFYVAQHRGIFVKHGLQVNIVKFANGGEGVDAAAAGQVDISGAAELTTMIRIPHADLRPLAIYEQSGSYIKLLVRSDISSVSGIKSFGVIKGSTSEYSTALAIEKNNIPASQVKIIHSGPPELPALFARGDIDAYFAWEPWPTLGLKQGGKILLSSRDIGYSFSMWLTANGKWLDENRDKARALIAAMREVNGEIAEDPEKAAEDMYAETKLPPLDTLTFIKSTNWEVRSFSDADLASFDKIAQFLMLRGITPAIADFRKAIKAGAF